MTYSKREGCLYHFQDANWNVVSTLNSALSETERVVYDPYGLPSFYVHSGGSYLPAGNWTSPTGADFLFQGRWYYPLQTASGDKLRLYHFRNRAYGPALAVFLQRDPLTPSLKRGKTTTFFLLTGASPLAYLDPFGFLSGRRSLRGKDWEIRISRSCDISYCDLATHDRNLELLLDRAFKRLRESKKTKAVTVVKLYHWGFSGRFRRERNISDCMRKKMSSGDLEIVCHTSSNSWCRQNPEGQMFTKPLAPIPFMFAARTSELSVCLAVSLTSAKTNTR